MVLAIGEHGLMGKQNMFDHSMRVPLMIVGPGIPENKKIEADVYMQDVMATALDIAGIQKPEYVEFNSLMDLAKGSRSESKYKAIYGTYEKGSQRMIRKGDYKLILYPKSQELVLFNIKKDPMELNDISTDPGNTENVRKLLNELLKLQEGYGRSVRF